MDPSWATFIYNCLFFALAFYAVSRIAGIVRSLCAGERLMNAAGDSAKRWNPLALVFNYEWDDDALAEACELLRRHFSTKGK